MKSVAPRRERRGRLCVKAVLGVRTQKSDGETCAADTATFLHNLSARARFCPRKEAVCRGSLTFLRLIGSF